MSARRSAPLRTVVALAVMAVVATTTPPALAAPVAASAGPATAASYRHYLGTTSAPVSFRTSVPRAGRYALQYSISGTAFFDTYVGDRELGYVGGPSGTYTTTSVWLRAGRHVVQVVGPEGSGSARVYLVSARR
jgi:hypothetical protein